MVLSGCRISNSLTKNETIPTQGGTCRPKQQQNSRKQPKANQIAIGVDAHMKSYQAARKINNGAVGVDIAEQRSVGRS
jgi:hypothetical protein